MFYDNAAAVHAFNFDQDAETVVVDVDECTPLNPDVPDDEEPKMQICLDDGAWHRPMVSRIGLFKVACGEPTHPKDGHARRHETYAGTMCDRGCWTPLELDEAAKANEIAARVSRGGK